ncbi:MAG: nucleoside deaminase [Romboutsia timonensis]|uniref:nucleoside deaminase n=1 Tax=Romboutsia timonensis TaxID=1776391 RepID=UPI002A75B034|nr:nucleoside deaminase [Romboutsia timonensis]MDY3000459.1 nucleoside deaminase [Romboutsia timonensis]
MNKYMKRANELAKYSMDNNKGGCFGSVIVKDGVIVGEGYNTVTSDNDPTRHGEINAIKNTCKNMSTFDLSGCELYTSAYPCPMCLGAIMWANIKTVYYGATAQDTGNIGFRDDFMYEWLNNKNEDFLRLIEMDRKECIEVQKMWLDKDDKIEY